MENKRYGFTLIELLAVVVILGLLVAIAYPAVNKYINDTKESTYALHESDMKSSASNMMSECIQKDTEDCIPKPGESKTIYLYELIDKKYSNQLKDPEKKDGYCSNSDSYVIVTNTGDNTLNLEYEVCLTCDKYQSIKCSELKPGGTCDSNSDESTPDCGEIVGDSTLWTNKDRVISVKCSDAGCGCTKETFYKTFKETGKEGKITITDKAGNSNECKVNVYVDKDLPTCELEVVGAMGSNGWYGTSNAPVVRFKNKNDTTSGVATYGLGLSKNNPEFNKLDSYTVKEGVSTVFGYVKDNAGNITVCQTDDIYYDPVPSTIANIDYGSVVYPKEDMTTVSNKKTIKILGNVLDEYGEIFGAYFYQTSSTPGMVATIKHGTTEIASVHLSQGITEPIRILFSSPIKITNDVTIELSASNATDYISKIEFITRNDTVGYHTNKNVTLYINGHDSLSGKAEYSVDDGVTWSNKNYFNFSTKQSNIKAKIKDTAGNINEPDILKINNIDKLNPTVEFNVNGTLGTNGWYKSDKVTISITTSDAEATDLYSRSQVRYYDISLSNVKSYNNKTQLVQTDNTVGTMYYAYVIDNAGNEASSSINIKKDSVTPTIMVVAKEKNSGDVIASDSWASEGLNYTFTSTSGVSGFKVYYCKDTDNTCNPKTLVGSETTLTLTTLNNDVNQTYYLRYKIVSNAGISSSVYSYRAKVDSVTPTVTMSATRKDNSSAVSSGTWVNTGLNFKLTTSTVGISGAKIYYCKDTNNTCNPTTEINSGSSITSYNGLVNNVYYVRYKIVSNSGLSSSGSYTAKTDTTDPSCYLTANNSNVVFGSKSDNDGGAGLHSYDLLTSSSATYDNSTSKPLAVGTFYGHVKDNAGNTGSCSLTLKKAETYYTKTTRTCSTYNYVNCSKDATIKHYIKEHSSCYKYDVKYKCTQDATYSCSEGSETSDGMCKISYSNACQTEFGLASRNFACEECMARWGACKCGCILSYGWANVTIAKTASCPNGGTLSSGTCTLTNQTSIKVGWDCTQTSAKYTYDVSVQDYPGIAVCKNANPSCNKEADVGNEQVNCRPIYECKDGGSLSGTTCTKSNQYSCSSGWTSSTSSSTYLAWNSGTTSDVLSCNAVSQPTCDVKGETYVSNCSGAKYRCNSSLGNTKVGSGSSWYCF